jgi:hypothetical protein
MGLALMLVMITNTIVPYCYDIHHVIGLPIDLSHRFRYRLRWVKGISTAASLNNATALIVLRDFETSNLIPIRFVQIDRAVSFGDIWLLNFSLGGFVKGVYKTSIASCVNNSLQTMGYQNLGHTSLECLCFQINDTVINPDWKQSESDEIAAWTTILDSVKNLDCYRHFSFLKIYQIRDLANNIYTVQPSRTVVGSSSYALDAGKAYFLETLQQIPWEIEETEFIDYPFEIHLMTEPDVISPLRRIQKDVGKYDLLTFIFKVPDASKGKQTFLEIETRQPIIFGISSLFLPIDVC